MEKAVHKATRKDAVHPKQKHVDTLIQMTLSGGSMEELFMLVQDRFSEANWVISFKALILVHILMHEGGGPVMYDYLIRRPNTLDMTRFRDRHGTKGVSEFEQSKNVRSYAAYLNDKVLAYKAIRIDHVTQRNPNGSQIFTKTPTDIKFMLLEVSTVQKQLHSVLKNRFDSDTLDNETTFSAFRYCLRDMLKLFQVMNFGVMKMLKVYFDMEEGDMRRALDLYKRFVKLTDRTDEYLKIARQFEAIFGFSIPKLNHAPLSLSKALDDFLNMPADERKSTISAMKNAPKESVAARSAGGGKGGTGNSSNAKMGPNGRTKPDYGLRLKPELLALVNASPPQSAISGTVKSTLSTTRDKGVQKHKAPISPLAGAASSMTTLDQPESARTEDSGTAAKRAATTKEIDFIDFFSSIDDNATSAASNVAAPEAAAGPAVNTGSVGSGPAQQGTMSDFDMMFMALSNPFATSNGGGFDPLAAQNAQQQIQQQQQLQQPQLQNMMAGISGSPYSTMGSTNIASSIPVASIQQNPQQFNAFSGPSAELANTNMILAGGSNMTPNPAQQQMTFQTPQPQQDHSGNGSGYVDVSANNPFRQSMFPTMSDTTSQQALMVSQMAQMNLQQQSQQLQPTYNPFVQRQTMYMDDSVSGSLPAFQQPQATTFSIANTESSSQYAQFNTTLGNTSNNTGAATTGYQPQQQQQQQQQQQPMSQLSQPVVGAHNLQAAMNNGNFANFDFFK
ncbi:ANTH-domain-containing protein [Coemansia reversa NRRL 1564]|uniref:ANTH-domain-containing protein n=1 Tax=Coemansia reversa (strain ATCC 12441 / NRRL 1564) TaxID=763665 RepID=A0A2G5B9M6_COERN|nr:ANTH-domain-containing protein [Coemansia reversa NRRL 1564]|eukprot:PIA15723.1 ANTH-domain-containing protein [Coemansia reversa NRRL 1564]